MIVQNKSSWVRLLFAVRGSTLSSTWRRLLVTTLLAVVVTFIQVNTKFFTAHPLTTTPFALIGVALGIFLGFRNNTSYDRFWEGRKLWGRVVNASRTLTRQMLTLINEGKECGQHKDLVYGLIGYVHSLRLHLRDDDDLSDLIPFIGKERVEALANESNRPVALLQDLGDTFGELHNENKINSFHLPVLEASLTELTGVQGGCERIKATPIPFSYNVLLHRIVGVYCLALPFGVVDKLELVTPVVVALVSYAFFGLDAVGEEIEDPFGTDPNDLPLSAITRMIEVNLRQRLGETDLPPLLTPENGELL